MTVKALEAIAFNPAPVKSADPGPLPELIWVSPAQLVVDPAYQRTIQERGRRNIKRIVEEFSWRKFAPLIVTPHGPKHDGAGRYVVIDGQHRATAALMYAGPGVSLPAMVIKATPEQAADAFAAINGQVTGVTALQLHHARLAAGDRDAEAVADVCRRAGVEILRYPVPASKIKAGQTLTATALRTALARHGAATLITALQCVTETGDGNAGELRARTIQVLCDVLAKHPDWRDAGSRLLAAFDDFDFGAENLFAAERAAHVVGGARAVLRAAVTAHLRGKFAAPAAITDGRKRA